jgi:hypothetical protein
MVYTAVFSAPFSFSFSVENAYLEEKEDTCNALGEIAENVGYVSSDDCVVMSISRTYYCRSHFLPFMDDCFREINILTEVSCT